MGLTLEGGEPASAPAWGATSLRDRAPGGRPAQPRQGRRVDDERRLRPSHQEANRAPSGDPEAFKDFEEFYAAFEKQLQFCEDTLRKEAWIASILCAEYLPVTWRSILTKGCIETGTKVWNGGANYYTVAEIPSVAWTPPTG